MSRAPKVLWRGYGCVDYETPYEGPLFLAQHDARAWLLNEAKSVGPYSASEWSLIPWRWDSERECYVEDYNGRTVVSDRTVYRHCGWRYDSEHGWVPKGGETT